MPRVSQSAGDQQLREPGPRQLRQLGHGRAIPYVIADILTTGTNDGFRDAADDNFNAFDPFPPGTHRLRLNDQDYYDAAGALILPVDRMRRYVTPADINGTGSVTPWTQPTHGRGGRPAGQGQLHSYYRPPGSPGSIATSPTATATPPAPSAPSARSTIRRTQPATTSSTRNGPNNNPNPPPRHLHWPTRHTCPT